jgi:hypothetical protein
MEEDRGVLLWKQNKAGSMQRAVQRIDRKVSGLKAWAPASSVDGLGRKGEAYLSDNQTPTETFDWFIYVSNESHLKK